MHTVSQNKDKFTRNNLFHCCRTLIFTQPLVYEFFCGPKLMANPVALKFDLGKFEKLTFQKIVLEFFWELNPNILFSGM